MSYEVVDRPGLIKPPGTRRRRFIPLRFVAKSVFKRPAGHAELHLTPLVDLLLVLVVFLLQDFSASGELLCPCIRVPLPEAMHFRDLESAPVVRITADAVSLNGAPEADTHELLSDLGIRESIPSLYEDLVVLKNNFKLLHPEPQQWQGIILIEADKHLSFGVIGKVMSTCAAAGYSKVHFVIEHKV